MKLSTTLWLLLAIWVLYNIISFAYKLHISKILAESTTPFSVPGANMEKTMLVVGDSTAVGVGATSGALTVPAKVASYIGATFVENYAVSGAVIADLPQQISRATLSEYDFVLVQIGANDMVRFRSAEDASKELEPILTDLLHTSERVVLISAGNLGGAPLIPFFLKRYYTSLNLKYHSAFEALANTLGVTYVNLYTEPADDPFMKDPARYFAKDTFHPSDDGYAIWYKDIKDTLDRVQ